MAPAPLQDAYCEQAGPSKHQPSHPPIWSQWSWVWMQGLAAQWPRSWLTQGLGLQWPQGLQGLQWPRVSQKGEPLQPRPTKAGGFSSWSPLGYGWLPTTILKHVGKLLHEIARAQHAHHRVIRRKLDRPLAAAICELLLLAGKSSDKIITAARSKGHGTGCSSAGYAALKRGSGISLGSSG